MSAPEGSPPEEAPDLMDLTRPGRELLTRDGQRLLIVRRRWQPDGNAVTLALTFVVSGSDEDPRNVTAVPTHPEGA